MKTDKLEDFVKANRDDFDFKVPSDNVWEKIATDTKRKKTIKLRRDLLRVAAVVAIAAISWVVISQSGALNSKRIARNIDDPELVELIEAEAFYSHQVNRKLKELRKCYYTKPELKQDIENDLLELEDMYKVLKTDLKENIANKSVIEAMIENNRFRLKLCENVLEQIDC